MILQANTVGEDMFFIEHGTVAVLATNGKVVTYLKDGEFFGEMALVTHEKRVASVVATTYVDIYRLRKDDFEEAIHSYPKIYEQVLVVCVISYEIQIHKKIIQINQCHFSLQLVEERQKFLRQFTNEKNENQKDSELTKEFKEHYFTYVKRLAKQQQAAATNETRDDIVKS